MLRWLSEFFSPEKKCERLGHQYKQMTKRYYQWPGKGCRSVADECLVRIHVCRRCGVKEKQGDDEVISRESIHSLSMSSSAWRELEENGILEI